MAQKNKSLFPLLFSDLMMGAMGVIIVLLVFLQIVIIRGTATNDSVSQINLPPGLKDKTNAPITRIRALICGAQYCSIDYNWRGDKIASYFMDDDEGCRLWNIVFSKGLDGKDFSFFSSDVIDQELSLHLTLSIGGFTISPNEFKIKKLAKDTPWVIVSLEDPRIVYNPREN